MPSLPGSSPPRTAAGFRWHCSPPRSRSCSPRPGRSRDWPNLALLRLPDNEDMARLAQVRDWLGGQGFNDLTQHRLGPPGGASMHWSRIADAGPALLILLFTPLLGTHGAELAMVLTYPGLLFLAYLLLVARVAQRLGGESAATPALLLAAIALSDDQPFHPRPHRSPRAPDRADAGAGRRDGRVADLQARRDRRACHRAQPGDRARGGARDPRRDGGDGVGVARRHARRRFARARLRGGARRRHAGTARRRAPAGLARAMVRRLHPRLDPRDARARRRLAADGRRGAIRRGIGSRGSPSPPRSAPAPR
ncbi:MAG: hypothetical protein WDN44_10010 [Sphingomonas sp.]